MGNLGELAPHEARDAAGFIESMQQLKERSGLTYRKLEERAARSGDVLARSTLADVLRRRTLPRPDVLAAFVRACGDGHWVGAWLDARDRVRRGLAEELVSVPGPTLQRLHQQMLTSDPALGFAAPAATVFTVRPVQVPVPRQLPAPPGSFVGRDGELAALDSMLKQRSDDNSVLVICVIGGAGGIGQTWLALRWAHQRLDDFPD
ncbi:helix-turn-helix transcriptional regulator [Streptomyces sp. NPDC050211]|uniref:helix-turn-helix transcriptional regulator n=1 Tax=Streptomyces sp. NPDC050211 TaxID=3154932 RepID=UPI0034292E54